MHTRERRRRACSASVTQPRLREKASSYEKADGASDTAATRGTTRPRGKRRAGRPPAWAGGGRAASGGAQAPHDVGLVGQRKEVRIQRPFAVGEVVPAAEARDLR